MAVLRGGNLKKCHQIPVAWRVYNGGRHSHGSHGGIAKIAGFFVFFCAVGVGLTWPNPTRYDIQKRSGETQHKTQHTTRSDTLHPTVTPHAAATMHQQWWPRGPHARPSSDEHRQRTSRRRRALIDDPAKATPHRPRTLTKANIAEQLQCDVLLFFLFIFFCCLTSFLMSTAFFFHFSIWHSLFIFDSPIFIYFFYLTPRFFFFLFSPLLNGWTIHHDIRHPPFILCICFDLNK